MFFAAMRLSDFVPEYDTGIWRAGMDGSGSIQIVPNVVATLLTLDHSSQLLFWVQINFRRDDCAIFHSDLQGGGVKRTVVLKYLPRQLRIADSRLFWLDVGIMSASTLIGCEKISGSKKLLHDSMYCKERGEPVDFIIIPPIVFGVQPGTDDDYCIHGALCSHMCVPTSTRYMKCLCPWKYELEPDRWTCGEHKANTHGFNPDLGLKREYFLGRMQRLRLLK